MNIVVVGLSHKTAPVAVREKLSIQDNALEGAIAHLLQLPHVEEISVLSTCNRLEIYAVITEAEQGIHEITQFLSERSAYPISQLRRHLFILLHQDAIRHLMRVAAGLDSLILGEGQILSQVKHAHKLSQKYKGIGRLLDRLFKQSLSAGKRVRSNTNLGTGAMSISSAAVELASTKVNNLENYHCTIVGAGKMARLIVQHLIAKGATDISIVNRSQKRAQDLAQQFSDTELQLHPLEDMMSVISNSHLVFTSTGASEPILDRAKLEQTLDPNHQLLLFDISVPLNVANDVAELESVENYNVDDLKAVVSKNTASRRHMAQEAEALLDEEVESFEVWWRSLETVPTISCLREKVDTIREQELEKALSRLGTEFAEKHQEVIEALTRGIVNKILHEPMVELRAQQDIEMRRRTIQSLQRLFNLDPEQQYSS
ncbi:MAG: glutamyl-tRNA reductase [Halothece sp.]